MIPVSWLARYLYCPRQIYLEIVQGIKPEEDARMVAGSIVHKLLAKVMGAQVVILDSIHEGMNLDGFKQAFRDKYIEIARDVLAFNMSRLKQFELSPVDLFDKYVVMLKSLAHQRAKEAFIFSQTFHVVGEQLTDALFPKFQSEVFLESRYMQLKGSVDVVEVYKQTKLPVELKTSTPPRAGLWDSDQIQLAAYIMLLRESEGEHINKGVVEYLNHSKRIPVVLNPFMVAEVEKVRDAVLSMIENKQEPKLPETKDKCRHCSFKGKCWN